VAALSRGERKTILVGGAERDTGERGTLPAAIRSNGESRWALHNLIWVWSADPPGFGPNATEAYNDYFPGLLYVDALELNLENFNSRFRMDTFLAMTGVGKVIGVEAAGKIPDASFFTQQTGWA
jgi:hypothetical protein